MSRSYVFMTAFLAGFAAMGAMVLINRGDPWAVFLLFVSAALILMSFEGRVLRRRLDGRNYLIRKGSYWYRPDCSGYTAEATEAGRYTLDEALHYTHPNGFEGSRDNLRFYHVKNLRDPK